MKYKLLPFYYCSLVILLFSISGCREHDKPTAGNETRPTGTATFTDTSTSSVKVFDQNGRICIQQSNTYYELADVYEGASKIPLLLKIKKTELCFADSVNKDKVYEIEAQSILDTKEVKWNTQFVATEMSFKDNSLLAIHEGAEGEEDLITRFSLLDGKEVFGCSYGELKAIIPNVRNKRFIGYTSQRAVTHPVQSRKEENLLGIVRYSTGTEAVNGAKIFLKRSGVAKSIPLSTPDMVFIPADAGLAPLRSNISD